MNALKSGFIRKLSAYSLVIPALAVYTFIVIIPAVTNVQLSFTNWNGVSDAYEYIGIRNYVNLFRDPNFYKALLVTLEMSVLIIVIQQALGLALALQLEKNVRANVFFRSLFFIPNLLNTVVVGLLFSYAFSFHFGYVKGFFDMLGLHSIASIDWLGDGDYALYTVALTTVWQYAGLSMLLYISSLMNIPHELYESSLIDGASLWQRFKSITFPLIAPALTINALITLIGCIRLFDLPYVMTNGGPGNATQTIAILLYKDTFMGRNAGRGAADSTVLVVIILAFSLLQNSFLKRREVEL